MNRQCPDCGNLHDCSASWNPITHSWMKPGTQYNVTYPAVYDPDTKLEIPALDQRAKDLVAQGKATVVPVTKFFTWA